MRCRKVSRRAGPQGLLGGGVVALLQVCIVTPLRQVPTDASGRNAAADGASKLRVGIKHFRLQAARCFTAKMKGRNTGTLPCPLSHALCRLPAAPAPTPMQVSRRQRPSTPRHEHSPLLHRCSVVIGLGRQHHGRCLGCATTAARGPSAGLAGAAAAPIRAHARGEEARRTKEGDVVGVLAVGSTIAPTP